MNTKQTRVGLLALFAAAATITCAQPGSEGAELNVRSEITGSSPAGGLVVTHTVWNSGTEIADNVWLTNQLAIGVSFRATNKWPIGSPGPTYPEPPPPELRLAPIQPGTTFAPPWTASHAPAVHVALGDIDLDGWADVVVAHGTNAGGLTLYRTTGTNLLSAPTTRPTPIPATNHLRMVTIGDVDGDGLPDLVAADIGSSSVLTLSRSGHDPGNLDFQVTSVTHFATPITSIVVMDFDGDGFDDLAVLEPAAAVVRLLHNTTGSTGAAGFAEVGTLTTPAAPAALAKEKKRPGRESPSLASLGRLFVTSDLNGGSVSVFVPTGQNTDLGNLYLPRTDLACGSTPRGIAVADLDGDGLEDLAIANATPRSITLLRATAVGDYSSVGSVDCGATGNVTAIHLLDLNGDGRPDLLTGSAGQPECIVLPNSRIGFPLSTGQFGPPVHFALTAPFRNLGFDTCADGSQVGGFVVVGHTGPAQGALAGGESFTLLSLTHPGAEVAIPLGHLEPGQATGIALELEVRVPNATSTVLAVAGGGTITTGTIPDKIPLATICGAIFCTSGGVTQGMGGFAVTVQFIGTGYYFSNSTVTLPNGTYCLDLPFSCGGVFPWDTMITITSPACPGQTWTYPVGVLFASMTLPPVYCGNCTQCSNVLTVLTLNSGSGASGLLPLGSLDPQFATGNPPFANANPYVTGATGGWLPDGPTSQWIGPDLSFASPGDTYCYTNRFYMPCTNSARLNGQWTVAGDGGEVVLNGAPTGNSLVGSGLDANWYPLNILGGFQVGWNSLVFCVTNSPGSSGLPTSPTGLRVELAGTAVCCTGCTEIHCPSNIVSEVCTNGPAPFGDFVSYPAPAAFSHCGLVTNSVCLPPSGSFFPLGTNVVVCMATDSLGNTATCTFKIIVRPDFTPPTVLQCPPLNVTLMGCPAFMPDFTTNVVAIDNCSSPGEITLTQSIPAGTPLPGGQTVAIINICDAAGNCTACDVIITVFPTGGNPTITCPPNQVLLTCSNTAVSHYKVAASGQNGPIVCSPPSGTPLPLGINWITCTATNSCGGITSCTFSVTVKPQPNRWACRQVGIGIPFDAIGGATVALRPGIGIGDPAICIFPNPANPASGVLLDVGQAQAFSFTTMLDFTAPIGSGMDLMLPPNPAQPNSPPLLSLRSKGAKGYCVKTAKGLVAGDPGVTAYAINTNGNLLEPLTFTAAEIDADGVFDIGFQPGVTNCHVTVEVDLRTGAITIEFPGPVTPSASRKGWDGCIYGPDRPVKKPTSRVAMIPPAGFTLPRITELSLRASGVQEISLQEPTITASERKWGDGHVTLMKAYDDGESVEFRAVAPGGGVQVDLGQTESFDLRLTRFETNLAVGEQMLTLTIGPIRGLTNRPAPPEFLDAMLLQSTSSGVECSVDFSNLGSPTVQVQIYNGGVLVAERSGVPADLGQRLFTLPEWPETLGKLGGRTPCRRGTIRGGPFSLLGSAGRTAGTPGTGGDQIVIGDEFRILAELAEDAPRPDYYSAFEFIVSEDADWGVSDLQRTLACDPAVLDIELVSDSVVITWSDPGHRLQGAAAVTGPWFDLGVPSPAELDAHQGARFFRLACD